MEDCFAQFTRCQADGLAMTYRAILSNDLAFALIPKGLFFLHIRAAQYKIFSGDFFLIFAATD